MSAPRGRVVGSATSLRVILHRHGLGPVPWRAELGRVRGGGVAAAGGGLRVDWSDRAALAGPSTDAHSHREGRRSSRRCLE
jgi:hypothetical protein